jgi:hypothetical protein
MTTFKLPPKLSVAVDPYAALITAAYLRQASQKEPAPTLSSMLDYASTAIFEALQKTVLAAA